jgi:hypothetical protein
LGGFTGAPDEYKIGDDLSDLSDDPMVQDFKGLAKELGMSQEAFNKVLSWKRHTDEQVSQTHIANEMTKLGKDGQAIVDQVSGWVKANLSPEEQQAAVNMATSADNILLLQKLIGMSKGSSPASISTQGEGMSEEKLTEMLNAPAPHNPSQLRVEVDFAYSEKVRRAYDQFYAGR